MRAGNPNSGCEAAVGAHAEHVRPLMMHHKYTVVSRNDFPVPAEACTINRKGLVPPTSCSELVGRRVVGAAHLHEMHALLQQFLHLARGETSVAAGGERLVFVAAVNIVRNNDFAPFLPDQ